MGPDKSGDERRRVSHVWISPKHYSTVGVADGELEGAADGSDEDLSDEKTTDMMMTTI